MTSRIDALLDAAAIAALTRRLIPRAAILTPNLPEAARLLGVSPASSPAEIVAQGRALLDLGPGAVLMKGGHAGGPCCTDRLVGRAGVHEVSGEVELDGPVTLHLAMPLGANTKPSEDNLWRLEKLADGGQKIADVS